MILFIYIYIFGVESCKIGEEVKSVHLTLCSFRPAKGLLTSVIQGTLIKIPPSLVPDPPSTPADGLEIWTWHEDLDHFTCCDHGRTLVGV